MDEGQFVNDEWVGDIMACSVSQARSAAAEADTAAHMARAFQVRRDRYIDITRSHGNQIAASIPTAFSEARDRGQIKDGARVLLLGTSAGVQFGAAALIA